MLISSLSVVFQHLLFLQISNNIRVNEQFGIPTLLALFPFKLKFRTTVLFDLKEKFEF